jgi:hypothetical protein
MDPELQGKDPLWAFLLSGKAHIFYALIAIMFLAVIVDAGGPRWFSCIIAALACGVFADCWAHQVLH